MSENSMPLVTLRKTLNEQRQHLADYTRRAVTLQKDLNEAMAERDRRQKFVTELEDAIKVLTAESSEGGEQ